MSRAVVVSGGSSGIGLRFVVRLLRSDYQVFSIGRTCPVVPAELAVRSTHFSCDLAADDYCVEIERWLKNHSDRFDFVGFVHSAGAADIKPLLDTSVESIVEQINVNLQSSVLLSKIILPYLNRQHSRIFFIGSRARRFPFLGGSAYCASKAGLYALSDCLALEVKKLGWNIGVSIFEFSTVATGFAGLPLSEAQISPDGAARMMMRIFQTSLDDYDVRVVEIVPAVRRSADV